jgi:hypothetical protein
MCYVKEKKKTTMRRRRRRRRTLHLLDSFLHLHVSMVKLLTETEVISSMLFHCVAVAVDGGGAVPEQYPEESSNS